jgi:glyoxylase-like metal-dependent hydrolase (beta-lactamase superfamily II)
VVLPLAYPGVHSVNAYLLELDDGLTLVDCGSALEPGWDALCHAVGQTGHRAGDIRRLICTHLHMDHAGLAGTLRKRTGCELVRGAGPDAGHDAFRDRWTPLAPRRARAARDGVGPDAATVLIGPLIGGDGERPRPPFDRLLIAGERLAGANGDWEVIAAPGHAGSQIVLWDATRRWLISADLVSPFPLLEYGSHTDPVASAADSLTRVLALGAERLLPGHGRPIEPADAVRAQLRAAADSLDAAVARAAAQIAQRPCSGFELSELLDPGNRDLEWRQSALSLAVCLLEHLEIGGRAEAITGSDGVRRFATLR